MDCTTYFYESGILESDDDEVDVEYDRVNDLLLYVADLEDWLEREGYTDGN